MEIQYGFVGGDPVVAPGDFPRVPKPADVGFWESISGPAWNRQNMIRNAFTGNIATPEEIAASERVDVWGAIEGTKYEAAWDSFAHLNTSIEVERMKEKLDREESDRQLIEDAGLGGMAAELVAGVFDLPSLIPGTVALRGGKTAIGIGARTAVAAGLEATAVEAFLQSQQETRTAAESGFAIGGSVVLGGLLGTAVGALIARSPGGQEAFNAAAKAFDEGGAEKFAGDLSAAARIRPEITDFDLPTVAAQKLKDTTPSGLSFTDRFANSRSPTARAMGNDLLQNSYAYAGTERLQMQPAVDTFAAIVEDKSRIAIGRVFKDDYAAYKKAPGDRPILSRYDFGQRVSAAMRRGDVDPEYPEVAAAAAKLRQQVVEPLKKQAIDMGLLPENVTPETAVSYFTRMWDQNRLIARSDDFLRRAEAHFANGIRAGEFKARQDGGNFADFTPDEIKAFAREAAEDVFKTLTRTDVSPTELLNVTVGVERGPLAARTFNVKDVDFEDFLNSDAEFVLGRYARVMSAETELTRRFGRADMKDQISEVHAEYDDLRNAAKTEKERAAIEAERARVIKSLKAARDQVRGTYLAADRASGTYRAVQGLQTFNYVRALGDVLRSSLTDVFKLPMVHGMQSFLGDGIAPLIRATKTVRAAQREIADAAGIAEVLLNNRMMRIADITDPYATRTPIENTLNWMGSKASLFSGILHWNQFLKEIDGYMLTKRLQRLNVGNPSQRDARMLQRLKITKSNMEAIQEQMRLHGQEIDGVFIPNLEDWDAGVERLFSAAVRADTETVIVTPGIGDKVPLTEEKWLLKPALQFKQFALASHRRTLGVGLQEDQARFASNAALMVSMGMFVYWLKAQSLEKDKLSDNPGTWLAEGIDRSGLVPIHMELNNMFERVNGPGVYYALGSALGDDPQRATRYQVRSQFGSMLGPTFGLGTDVISLAGGALSGDLTPGDIGSARRLVPFGNIPGIKEFLNLWAVPRIKEAVQ